MSTIWFLKEGEGQIGRRRATKTVEWCVKNLGLRQDNWFDGPEKRRLTIGQKTSLGDSDFRFVVLKIDDDDLRGGSTGWKLGYYLLDMNARDAKGVLGTVS